MLENACAGELKNIPIEDLGFTVRTFNVLKRANINTVADIFCLHYSEIQEVKNIGIKSKNEVLRTIREKYDSNWLVDEIKALSIEELSLSENTFNQLNNAGIRNIENILSLSFDELQNLCNYDNEYRDEVIYKIRENYSIDWLADEIRAKSISELNLSVRAFNVLKKAGITAIGDLINLSYNDLENIRHITNKERGKIIFGVRKMCITNWLVDEVKSIEVDKICLSDRALNGLKKDGIYTLKDVISLSYHELRRATYLGKKSRSDIIKTIREIHDPTWLIDEIKEIPIQKMFFSNEIWYELEKMNVFTIGDILKLSLNDICISSPLLYELINQLKEFDVLTDE